MIDFDYLYKGVCGLANAHKAGTLAGHLGAAVAAGYFIGEDQSGLPNEVFKGIEGELKRVIAGEEAIWFNAKKAGVTPTELFQPFAQEKPVPHADEALIATLQKNVSKTRQSGHNIIFASIALRALHDHEEFATPKIINGLTKLTAGFNNAHPGRGYYGKKVGWKTGNQVELSKENNFPMYKSVEQMAEVMVQELINTASIKKQGYGGLWHLINHAAAITEIERLGFPQVAKQALPAHHFHIRLWRSLPDVESELGATKKSEHDPRESIYWQGMIRRDSAQLTHRVKTIYGFDQIKRFVFDEGVKKKAEQAFLYLMS